MYTLVHAILGYFLLLIVVRVLTRRPGAQMTMFEFVIVFLMGGVIILSTVGNDRSVTNCTCAVIVVGFLHRSVSWLKTRNPRFGAFLDGTPLVLYKHGQWQDEVMQRMKLAPDDVMAAARTKGLRSIDQLEYAVLERNGGISTFEKEQEGGGEQPVASLLPYTARTSSGRTADHRENNMPPPTAAAQHQVIETDVPARLDRLPWSAWHTRIIIALGTSWMLDGLQVTLAGSLAGILENKSGLGLTDPQVTAGATTYLAGAVAGAILFGYLTDRLGRKKLFLVTLATYSLATLATALSWNFLSFTLFRFITGLGIGGEYAAINSAVDELIPGKLRGTVDLLVNGTFWVGAAVGSLASVYLLSGHGVPVNLGWRIAFGIGALLGGVVLLLRLRVPESPRWLMLRGREEEAGKIIGDIEQGIEAKTKSKLPPPEGDKLKITVRDHTPWSDIFRNMLVDNRERSVLGLVLMIAQAFFFNAVFFTYGLVVKKFFGVADRDLPMQLLPFALGSFLGPVLLGPLFDRVGRKPMIIATYGIAGLMLVATAVPFAMGHLTQHTLGLCFSCIFFVASSAASAAYLTVSEIFPLEIRAFAIAIFYAIGTLMGGVGAPLLFGLLINTNSRLNVSLGWALGSVLMLIAATVEYFIGVEAAGKSLESISKPLQSS